MHDLIKYDSIKGYEMTIDLWTYIHVFNQRLDYLMDCSLKIKLFI